MTQDELSKVLKLALKALWQQVHSSDDIALSLEAMDGLRAALAALEKIKQ